MELFAAPLPGAAPVPGESSSDTDDDQEDENVPIESIFVRGATFFINLLFGLFVLGIFNQKRHTNEIMSIAYSPVPPPLADLGDSVGKRVPGRSHVEILAADDAAHRSLLVSAGRDRPNLKWVTC